MLRTESVKEIPVIMRRHPSLMSPQPVVRQQHVAELELQVVKAQNLHLLGSLSNFGFVIFLDDDVRSD